MSVILKQTNKYLKRQKQFLSSTMLTMIFFKILKDVFKIKTKILNSIFVQNYKS